MSTLPTEVDAVLSTAIRAGLRLHGFLSGGGLRVLSLRQGDDARAYGEHPNVEGAFEHLAEDFLAGGREYREVYGKLHTHYLTGSSVSSSPIDAWLRKGSEIDVSAAGQDITCTLKGYSDLQVPEDIAKRAREGETVRWSDKRGFVFESSPFVFTNGDRGYTTCVVEEVEGRKPFFYPVAKTGCGDRLSTAIDAALAAEPEEVWDDRG